ncbi:unnamed protein product [Colias eurytheme]|nr:unnamed protein product [Colias eurytheme]
MAKLPDVALIFPLFFLATKEVGGNPNYSQSLLPGGDDFIQYLQAQCVRKLLNNFPCGKHVNYVFPEYDMIKLDDVDNNCYSFTARTYQTNDWLIEPDIYVIYYRIVENGSKAWHIRHDRMWNPRASFIVVITEEINENEQGELFDKFLNYNIFDVVVIASMNRTQTFLTYFPFGNGNCGKKYDEIINLKTCSNSPVFELNKDELDFTGCSINALSNSFKSRNRPDITRKYFHRLEQKVLNISAKLIGVKINYFIYSDTSKGVVLPNFTSTGNLHYLQKRKVDIIFGFNLLTKNNLIAYEYIDGFKYSTMKIVVPLTEQNIESIIYRPFSTMTLLTTTIHKEKRITLNNFRELEYKPCISDNTREFYNSTYNIVLPGEQTPQCRHIDSVIETVTNSNDFYTVVTKMRFEWLDVAGGQKEVYCDAPTQTYIKPLSRHSHENGDYVDLPMNTRAKLRVHS